MENILDHQKMLSRLKIAQNLRFFQTIVALLGQLIATYPSLGKLFNPLVTTLNDAIALYKKPRALPQTPELEEWDAQRDAYYSAIHTIVKGKMKSPLAAAAVKAIWPHLKNYGVVSREEYEQETEDIDNLLFELLKPENAAHLATLGIVDEVNALRQVNEAFQTKYIERSGVSFVKKGEGTSGDYRAKLNRIFDLLSQAINGLILVEEDPVKLANLKKMAEHINATITQFDEIYHRHEGNLGHKDEGPQSPDITLPEPPEIIIPIDPEEPEGPEEPDIELPEPPHPSFE